MTKPLHSPSVSGDSVAGSSGPRLGPGSAGEGLGWVWKEWPGCGLCGTWRPLLVLPHITLCPHVLLLFLYRTYHALTFDIRFCLFVCHVPPALERKFHEDRGCAALSGASVGLQPMNISFIHLRYMYMLLISETRHSFSLARRQLVVSARILSLAAP